MMWNHWGFNGRKDWGFVSGIFISISEHIYICQEQSKDSQRDESRQEDGHGPSELRVNVSCPYGWLAVGSAGAGASAKISWRRATTSEMRKGFWRWRGWVSLAGDSEGSTSAPVM